MDPALTGHELVAAMLADAQRGTPSSRYGLDLTVKRMLDASHRPSKRRAAQHLGLWLKDLTGARAIAHLPAEVLVALDCPTAIRATGVPILLCSYERDLARFRQRLAQVKAERVRSDARALFRSLTTVQ
ncbi:hypothetical protein [Aquincola tertiaricarbonis]|uniref:hypothetical protein n=1 Tax=Aquincola tertiaricarbonis TaxID=391953 RepID=UPI000615190E|nr:hypothetical protein [Aquincola tertiaricarbonis]